MLEILSKFESTFTALAHYRGRAARVSLGLCSAESVCELCRATRTASLGRARNFATRSWQELRIAAPGGLRRAFLLLLLFSKRALGAQTNMGRLKRTV